MGRGGERASCDLLDTTGSVAIKRRSVVHHHSDSVHPACRSGGILVLVLPAACRQPGGLLILLDFSQHLQEGLEVRHLPVPPRS